MVRGGEEEKEKKEEKREERRNERKRKRKKEKKGRHCMLKQPCDIPSGH